jgi:hypothetical protein
MLEIGKIFLCEQRQILQHADQPQWQVDIHVKPDKFDGTAAWLDFKSHFDVCTELNGWPNSEKGMHLAVSL